MSGINPYHNWAAGQSSSVYGALPWPPSAPADSTIIYFTSLNPSILNCRVVDRQSRPLYTVSTDTQVAGYTVLKNAANRNTALIEWLARPAVEIRDITPKQNIRDWLRLSKNQSSRYVIFKGVQYVWVPDGESLCLKTTTPGPETLARVLKSPSVLTLEITANAIRLGLIEVIIVSTIIFQSGRNIDA